MAGRGSLPTSVFTVAALLLLGLGTAWWLDAEPVAATTATGVPVPRPAYGSVLVLEADGTVLYELPEQVQLRPRLSERSPLERMIATELPCGPMDRVSIHMGDHWMQPVEQVSPLTVGCPRLRIRGR